MNFIARLLHPFIFFISFNICFNGIFVIDLTGLTAKPQDDQVPHALETNQVAEQAEHCSGNSGKIHYLSLSTSIRAKKAHP